MPGSSPPLRRRVAEARAVTEAPAGEERQDPGGGRRRRRAVHGLCSERQRQLQRLLDPDQVGDLPDAVAVSADGHERTDAQRPVRGRLAEPAKGVARGPRAADLHGQHGVVARQGAVAERAAAAPLALSAVRVRHSGGNLAVVRGRAAQGVAGPAGPARSARRGAVELLRARRAVRVQDAGERWRGAPRQRVPVLRVA
jgi:hypothetical protein